MKRFQSLYSTKVYFQDRKTASRKLYHEYACIPPITDFPVVSILYRINLTIRRRAKSFQLFTGYQWNEDIQENEKGDVISALECQTKMILQ